MYDQRRYVRDLKRSLKLLKKSSKVFGRKILTTGPWKAFGSCFIMSMYLVLFTLQFLFFTSRRLLDR